MNQRGRIWCQQDFAQLYEEEPKIESCSTYITTHLSVQDQIIDVKIPSTASQQVFKFLLYKAVYFHYLNQKNSQPLLKTAQISLFQSDENYNWWHNLWASGLQIPKNTKFQCVPYLKDESLFKYIFLALIEQNQQYKKVLARSRQDGRYYNIIEFDHNIVTQQHLNFLERSYKTFQHPFVSRLCQIHKTSSHSYFIFEHIPFTIGHILNSDVKLTKQQIYTCFVQFLMVIIFLEQQQLFVAGLDLHMIDVNIDGHLAVNQKIVCFNQNTQTQRTRDNASFLSAYFNILISSSDVMDQRDSISYENHVDFAKYLIQISQKKKSSLVQILNHPWIQQKSIQNILSKNTSGISVKKICKTQKYDQMSSKQITQFFQRYYEENSVYNFYESYQISYQTTNQMIMNKYNPNCQTKRSKKTSSRSICRLAKTNSSTSKTDIREQSLRKQVVKYGEIPRKIFQNSKQSPYCMVLKKQGCLRRKKPLKN